MPSLILFPVPIGADDINVSLPAYNRELLNTCRTFIVEDVRTARRNLKRMGYTAAPFDDCTFYELNEHTRPEDTIHYLDPISQGCNVGLMSEAGLPCIADPGNLITAEAQRQGIDIIPLVGPSSIMLSLMASGFNGQNFAFLGYPPIDGAQRSAWIKKIETSVYRDSQTQIFIEAPYRNDKLLDYLARNLQPTTRICVACDLTLPSQYIHTRAARKWLTNPPQLHKHPAIFLIYM
ncbi:MAG: SAM-dependent methyltransferase [Bacteroidales bacterium]|nr:SAM-dependent methyltransferase [Bacteroidales bacterium]